MAGYIFAKAYPEDCPVECQLITVAVAFEVGFKPFQIIAGLQIDDAMYAQYEKEGAAFVPKYKKLLYTTPIATAEDTAKVAGIDLTDRAFWCSALQTIADQIDMFCALMEEA